MADPSRSALLGNSDYLRLWTAGGIGNATLWLEILAASLFTLQVTGSGWAVAVVSAARSLPLLGFGAVVGVMAEAWDRKRILLISLLACAMSSTTVGALALAGMAQPWHLGVAALVSGFAYATEMPGRRRMVAECAGPGQVDRAVATDSLTSYATRCLGPLAAGMLYQRSGLAGAYLASAALTLLAVMAAAGVSHRQEATGRLSVARLGRDLRAGLVFAWARPSLLALLAVTVAMNLCGYSYATLLAPFGRGAFALDASAVGLLAASEPGGAFLCGLLLTRVRLPGPGLAWLMGGVAGLLAGMSAAAAIALGGGPFALACATLALGGCGSAIYTNKQITLAMAEAPPAMRSRVMGLLTVCIGSWPLGMLLAGELNDLLSPSQALLALAGTGFVLLLAILPLATVAVRRLGPATP